VFPKSSNEVFHKKIRFVQKWHILMKVRDAKYLDDKIDKLKKWLTVF